MTAPDGPLRFGQPTWGRPRRRPRIPDDQAPLESAVDEAAEEAVDESPGVTATDPAVAETGSATARATLLEQLQRRRHAPPAAGGAPDAPADPIPTRIPRDGGRRTPET